MDAPLGRHHPTIRRLRALVRDGALRRTEGVLVAEGLHLAREALASRASIELVLVAPRLAEAAEGRELRRAIEDAGLVCLETSDAVLESVQDTRSPQPILVLVRQREVTLAACLDRCEDPPLIAVAHALQDPGNLGSLLRSADAAGAGLFFTTGESVDLTHPRLVRASMGSIFRVSALAVDLESLLRELAERRIATVGAAPADGELYTASDLTGPTALIFGREGTGLPADLLGRLDRRLRIPMRAGVDSLSVAAAGAVLLFEAARQRRSRNAQP